MSSTPILPFAVWQSGTNQNSIPANDNSLRNQILNGLVIGVEDDAPGGDANGDIYIVGDTPAGAFASFDEHDLVIYDSGTWYAFAPSDGIVVNVAGTLKSWDGSSSYIDVVGASGDVTGPASSTADSVALFDGITGKLLKDGAKTIAQIREIEQNSQSAAYTMVLDDAGKHILHPSADTTARTFTIPANSSVAFPIGTAITFVNQNAAGVVTIAITTDTMRLAGAGATGSRTLAANGIATALKLTSTEWIISGTGLT